MSRPVEGTEMIKVCAWCTREISGGDDPTNSRVSHGICPDCRDHFFPSEGPPQLAEFLDKLSVPVLVVDNDVRVLAANEKASSLLGKEVDRVVGCLGGDAIECSYARLPGGCGKQIHCRSCTIRRTVLDTYETGASHFDVPACADILNGRTSSQVEFLISTAKSGDYVFLKIVTLGQ